MSDVQVESVDVNQLASNDIESIRAFVNKELQAILEQRRGLKDEQRVSKRPIEFGVFFAAGDCCTDDGNT